MSGPHVESHRTTTVQRDGAWWVFCYACQRDVEPFDAARAAAPSVEPRTHDFDGREWCRWCKGTDENAPCVPPSPEPTPGLRATIDGAIRDVFMVDVQPGPSQIVDAVLAALAASPAPEPDPAECAICGDYSAQGVEVHESCLEMLSRGGAAAPEPTGLDAERLRKAMDVVVPESIPPLYWTNERLAVALAAEYARLTDSGATDGE